MTEMTDAEIRQTLGRIDPDYFGDFGDKEWDLWFGAARDGFMEKFAVMLAERQAALEEIMAMYKDPDSQDEETPSELGNHDDIYSTAWDRGECAGINKCVGIARNATGGK